MSEREDRFRAQFDAEGKAFLGRRAVRKQSRHGYPSSKAPRFKLSPTVAASNRQLRTERLQKTKQWRAHYAEARAQWLAGNRDVLWPHGTYAMRLYHSVPCHPPPV